MAAKRKLRPASQAPQADMQAATLTSTEQAAAPQPAPQAAAPAVPPATEKAAPKGRKPERAAIIAQIERARGSRVVSYICSDRSGAGAQISDDAIRPMYDVVQGIGDTKKLDLFLYSRGGAIEVPWRIISMLREYCKELAVLIPFRAQSAATLIALGCDEIVMARKAELGPIDPALNRVKQEGGSVLQEEIRVEDVMSYVAFLKDKAGLGDQQALAKQILVLSEKLSPWVLGSIYRTHSHIRSVANKMLTSHAQRLDEQRNALIVEQLAERTYSHGHAITRKEAKELGMPVLFPSEQMERQMWDLLAEYERLMEMRRPVDAEQILGPDRDEGDTNLVLSLIESREMTWAFRGGLKVKRVRQAPPQININVNLGVTLPEGLAPELIPQEMLNQLLSQVREQVPGIVREQTRKQSAVQQLEARLHGAYWQNVTGEGL